MSELGKKVNDAIKIIKMASIAALERESESISELQGLDLDGVVEISYSTGKDSDVILHLAKIAGIKHIPIYKHTGIDPAGSIQHAREVGAVILKPKKSFFKLIECKGLPTRRARFCCSSLKEYKVLDVSIQGIRTSESRARAERYKEPQICRMYNKKDHVQVFLPILEWTDDDVKEFVKQEHIKCHPHYYDENGEFHVERRLGCMCCPLQSIGKLQKDFLAHPQMARAYIQHGKIWWENHPQTKSHSKFGSIYDIFYCDVFCKSYTDYQYKVDGLFGKLDTKEFLENYFKINL